MTEWMLDTEALWLIRNNEMQFWIVCANAKLRFSLWNQIKEHWALLFIVQLNCKLPFSLVATFPHFLFARSSYDSLHFEILSFLIRFSLLIFIGLLLLSCLLNRFSNLSFQSSKPCCSLSRLASVCCWRSKRIAIFYDHITQNVKAESFRFYK